MKRIREKAIEIRRDLIERGLPEEKINDFIFKKYQVELNERILLSIEEPKLPPLTKEEKKLRRKVVDKEVYQRRKEEIKITVIFKQRWKELRREYWRRREEWAAQYNKCEFVNEWFDGCQKHHISKNIIVCIPKELHRSMYHSLRNGKNMLRINDLVFEWLDLQK